MITKINKIKNLGLVFTDYAWNKNVLAGTSLPEFKRYNLIYGWNASGKTTLSKLFDAIENGELKAFPDLEYEIENGDKYKFKNGEKFNQKVRVFNQDYIENNIKIREGKAKSITLILGDVDKQIVEQIEEDKTKLKSKNDELRKQNEILTQKTKSKNSKFTEIAKTIYVAILGGAVRNYIKTNAESDFSNLKQKALLSDEELEKYAIVVKQKLESSLNLIQNIKIKFNEESKDLNIAITELIDEARTLLGKTVESQLIERLKDNPDISSWVELGIKVHQDHESANCEFCGSLLSEERLSELSKHFSEEDRKLKEDVNKLQSVFGQISSTIENITYPDKARLYEELHNNYETKCSEFEKQRKDILEQINIIKNVIENKKIKTTESLELKDNVESQNFNDSLIEINDLIENHNKKTSDFEKEKSEAVNKLKNHYLSSIFDEVKNLEKEISVINGKMSKLEKGDKTIHDDIGVNDLKKRISENQAKISSTYKACKDINKGLETFLGRTELVFEPHKTKITDDKGQQQEVDDGYIIKRNNELARNLSESEKTAIAFVYFTIHLKDQDFDFSKGIIIIDDPVSSLDSNCLFQAFAFLKNAVKDAEQVFIFTHSFELLKLLLNWQKNNDHGNHCGFYMLKNCCDNKDRCAYIDNMDKELRKYESEYHYLFKQLYKFESDGTIDNSYPIPNIARKVLDTFLLFRVPSGATTYNKLMQLQSSTGYDENRVTAIYKFVNDQSHITGSGFDPALVPETQKNVKYLLDMMKTVFPDHYQILEASIT